MTKYDYLYIGAIIVYIISTLYYFREIKKHEQTLDKMYDYLKENEEMYQIVRDDLEGNHDI